MWTGVAQARRVSTFGAVNVRVSPLLTSGLVHFVGIK